MQIFSKVAYSLIFVLGTARNGLVIFITGFRMKKTVHMVWILNLAIADFTFSFFLLFSTVFSSLEFHWPFGEDVCKLRHVMVFLSLFASVYFLTVISIDRCIATWCPVWAPNHRTPQLAFLVVLGIWIVSLLLCSLKLYFTKSFVFGWENKTYCILHYDFHFARERGDPYVWGSTQFVFGFIIPFIVIAFCYGAIVVRLRRDRSSQSSRPFKVITAVIVAFLVCWFPLHFFCIFYVKANRPETRGTLTTALPLSPSLAYFNSCLNPILYFCIGYNFKEKLRCSLLSALANAFTEESNLSNIKTSDRPSA
ncbi:N-formyl peptide receptor 3-like [Tiliqua scincoides]|uniref:N-formyl peptide receptor 3-like n=1 Tax=Tiliqua scincoides TaxID=71010 RepID=UPI0034623D50